MTNYNLVISGGASHGWTLWGAYRRAKQSLPFSATAGASIGACIAAVEALKVNPADAESLLKQLTQGNGIVGGADLIRFHPRLLWARGGGMHDWSHAKSALQRIFGMNTRMRDTKIPLNIVVGDVYTGTTYVINSVRDPSCLVWEALAASTAVWPVADAQEIPSLGYGNRLFVDGGWGNNIPTEVFESDQTPTCIISLGSDAVPTPTRRDGFTGVVQGCLDLALWDRGDIPQREDDIKIHIVPKGSGFDFDLDNTEIQARVFAGRNAAARVLQ